MPRVGDKVLLPPWVFGPKRKDRRTGIIVHIDGAYHDIKPSWCNWVVELYPNEFRVLGKSNYSIQKCVGFYRKYLREYFGVK